MAPNRQCWRIEKIGITTNSREKNGAKTAETTNPRKGRRSDRGFTSLPGSLLFWMCSVHDSTVWQPITCPSSAAIPLWVWSTLGKQMVEEFLSLSPVGLCIGTNLKAHLKRNAYGSAWNDRIFLAPDPRGNCGFATTKPRKSPNGDSHPTVLIRKQNICVAPPPLLYLIQFTP